MKITKSFLKSTPLAEGGEGIIFEKDGKIVKVYKPHVNRIEKRKKIEFLMSVALPREVVKPLELVFDEGGVFVGYLMDKVCGEELRQLSNKKTIKSLNVKMRDILKVLVSVKTVIQALHSLQIVVGDLNDCNILFDSNFDVHFIDVDSWSIPGASCNVCVDSFKDPLLVGDKFTVTTDCYAFAVMSFKSLTKMHPFGGTMIPDVSLVERMQRGISVIDSSSVVIPRTIASWHFIPPKLLKQMKGIFELGKRALLSDNLDEFYNNLTLCKKDNEYYYSKFSVCPYCDAGAQVFEKPAKINTPVGPAPVLYFTADDARFILSLDSYVSRSGDVVSIRYKTRVKAFFGSKIYFVSPTCYVEDAGSELHIVDISAGVHNVLLKKLKSSVQVEDQKVYFISPGNKLMRLVVTKSGNAFTTVATCAPNALFSFAGDSYFVCNSYDHNKIVEVDGQFYTLENSSEKIVNYGIHKDKVSGYWLFVYENSKGVFKTYVFDGNVIKFSTDLIKYSCMLSDMCFNNNTIFAPNDGCIKGYSWQKNAYKDFVCGVVSIDSRLVRDGARFLIINDAAVYTFG